MVILLITVALISLALFLRRIFATYSAYATASLLTSCTATAWPSRCSGQSGRASTRWPLSLRGAGSVSWARSMPGSSSRHRNIFLVRRQLRRPDAHGSVPCRQPARPVPPSTLRAGTPVDLLQMQWATFCEDCRNVAFRGIRCTKYVTDAVFHAESYWSPASRSA